MGVGFGGRQEVAGGGLREQAQLPAESTGRGIRRGVGTRHLQATFDQFQLTLLDADGNPGKPPGGKTR